MNKFLHIPPSSNPDRLAVNVREIRARNAENSPRRLLGTRRATQRNVGIGVHLHTLLGIQLLAGDTQGNLGAVGGGDEGTGLLGGGQTGGHVAEGNGVRANAEGWAPFFGDCLGQAHDSGFGDGVVGLASVGVC